MEQFNEDAAREAARDRPRPAPDASQWERSVLADMARSIVDERRRARRWGIFFKLLFVAWAGLLTAFWLGAWSPDDVTVATGEAGAKITAVVRINGVIKADSENAADQVNASLRAAFKDERTAGVVLLLNSPGGSPVQSGLIYDEIIRLRKKYPAIGLHAVVEEVCASGGYYVAAAADMIHVDPASLVGSIGVVMDGFGFVGAMHKLGIERRMFTAGADKGFLDPFSPLSNGQQDHAQSLLDNIHAQFIDRVRKGRGDRLNGGAELFSGLVWTGAQAVELGLADATGSADQVARDVFKAEKLVDFSVRDSLIERLAKRVGVQVGSAFSGAVAEGLAGPQWR